MYIRSDLVQGSRDLGFEMWLHHFTQSLRLKKLLNLQLSILQNVDDYSTYFQYYSVLNEITCIQTHRTITCILISVVLDTVTTNEPRRKPMATDF